MTVPLRAGLYLRVSTARQAEHDVSIPYQKRQGEAYCSAREYGLVETYVEPGASATNDRLRARGRPRLRFAVLFRNGVPEGIRTPDLRFRKPLLYPAELPG